MNVGRMSAELNAVAREQYPGLERLLGMTTFLSGVSTRLCLRLETEYPFNLIEDDQFYPKRGFGFGRVISANWDEGIRAIHSEITSRELEHGWVYLEGKAMWVDSTLEASGADCALDPYIVTFLSYLSGDLTEVHTHPDKVVQQVVKDSPWLDYGPNFRGGAAAPSSADLIRMAQIDARVNPASKYTSAVISHYGATRYALVDRFAGRCKGVTFGAVNHNVDPVDTHKNIHSMLARLATGTTYMLEDTPAMSIDFHPIS